MKATFLDTFYSAIDQLPDPIKGAYEQANSWRQMPWIQNTIGIAQLIFGALAVYNLATTSKKVTLPPTAPAGQLHKKTLRPPKPIQLTWHQKAMKAVTFTGNISLLGTALTCRPMLIFYRYVAARLLTEPQIESFFGERALVPAMKVYLFVSIGSFIIGIPATIKYTHNCYVAIKSYLAHRASKGKAPSIGPRNTNLYVTVNTVFRGVTTIARAL